MRFLQPFCSRSIMPGSTRPTTMFKIEKNGSLAAGRMVKPVSGNDPNGEISPHCSGQAVEPRGINRSIGRLGVLQAFILCRVSNGELSGVPVLGDSGILEKSAINRRGDTATALTDATESTGPDKIDIRLRPVDDWLWTPLVNSESYGVHVNLKWRNDDMLEIDLAFGCFVQMTHLLHRIGPIHVTYHFTYNDPTLDLDLARSAPVTDLLCTSLHPLRG